MFLLALSVNTSTFQEASSPIIPEWLRMVLQYIWLPLVVPIIFLLVKYITNKTLLIKEITSLKDRDINAFVELYNNTIPAVIRIDVEEILKYVGKKAASNVFHHLYICKHAGKVVGFIKFVVSKPKKCLFIAYIAIDKDDALAKEYGVMKMIRKSILKHFTPQAIESIVTEIEQGKNGNYNTGLAKSISRYATAFKYHAYYIDVPYFQPQMPGKDISITSEEFMSLIYIPATCPENKALTKSNVLQLIEFIYLEIYGPSCNEVMCNCAEYNQYLGKLISDYKASFEDCINLIPLGGN